MDNLVKLFAILIVSNILSHLKGAKEDNIHKITDFEVVCKDIRWSEHFKRSCSFLNITVNLYPPSAFGIQNITNTLEIKELENWLDGKWLRNELCFGFGFIEGHVSFVGGLTIGDVMGSHSIENGSLYNVTCSRTILFLDNTKRERVPNEECHLIPFGADYDCRSIERKWKVQVRLQRPWGSLTQLLFRSIDSIGNKSSNCAIIPGLNDTLLQVSYGSCDALGHGNFLDTCPDSYRNVYIWQTCSKSVFGELVLYRDKKTENKIFQNLTELCKTSIYELQSCLNGKPLCEDSENFSFYKKLMKSYRDICADQFSFSEGHRCFQSIMSDNEMKDAYLSVVQNCSTDVVGKCLMHSRDVFCKAYAQYKAYSNCTTFRITYKYKRIMEDWNSARDNCNSTEIDPCSIKEPIYIEICSSGPHTELSFFVSILFCLSSWIKTSPFEI